ncbi:class I SAM-dependent RNA methyltransferase [Parasphaerochaeta coccoides]|uniref:(Uracil-5)-methyltransferase n=1 Tax=Parasphaerochaeta coccoides (strain ATCC BAA-1237 / DSM 17374 / SPN1) TaxID=760011 RepID=F4GHG7_PARC1|nr:methyltransferase [Parasphaerochaeta coccoides]AEC02556.1 (Uracil-5)-methyltransferase [Parasphaerochaeta coccoides DSM 17374]
MSKNAVSIRSLVQGGAGLGMREDGKLLFVEGALPGETVSYHLAAEKSSWAQAVVDEILEPSPQRVAPRCPFYDECGGCNLMHLSEDSQAEEKQRLFIDAMERTGGIPRDSLVLEPPASATGWEYRSRSAFHVDERLRQAGFLGRRSRSLVPLPSCPVLVSELSEVLAGRDERLWKAARKVKESLARISVFAGDADISYGKIPVVATVDGIPFHVSAQVFFQSNRLLMPSLIRFVLSHVKGERVMDLYAGVGVFSAFLEREGHTVIAVEKEPDCLELARLNAPRTRFHTAATEKWHPSMSEKVDTVVVDPPRTGLAPSVPALIASWKPERVIYVSCDSVTLARDLRKFLSEGYSPTIAQVFDLYPQTSHYEAAVVLDRMGELDRMGKSRSSRA